MTTGFSRRGPQYDGTYHEQVGRLLTDPAVSYWLAGEIRTLARRDVVDALADVERLAALTRLRYIESEPAVIVAEILPE